MLPKITFIGDFDSLETLWARYPNGGIEGEYARIGGVEYAWDKYERNWSTRTETSTPSTRTTDVTSAEGDTTSHHCCGCQQIVNVYTGCCGDGNNSNYEELREQIEQNKAAIDELKEELSELTKNNDTQETDNKGCCDCTPTTLTLSENNFCTIELTAAEAFAVGLLQKSDILTQAEETVLDETNGDDGGDNDGNNDETGTGTLENVTSAEKLIYQLPGVVCARISVPDGAIEQRMIGCFIDGTYAGLCEQDEEGGGNTPSPNEPVLPLLE